MIVIVIPLLPNHGTPFQWFVHDGTLFQSCQDVSVPAKPRRTERRSDALSKERIIAAAIDILDTDGEGALTFRALATRLTTGSGAIYWHVANKDDLLAATTDHVIARAMTGAPVDSAPDDAIRAIALAVFDAIHARPWVGTQISREPWQSGTRRIFEGLGQQLQALGVPERAQFNSASALVGYMLGLAAQYAAGARLVARKTSRAGFLTDVVARWTQDEPDQYPFVQQIADELREHDDREQFRAGIDLILAGIAAIR
jgi:AcrR family transcriptional regulator